MHVNIFSYSDQGCRLALTIANLFETATCYTTKAFASTYGLTATARIPAKVREIFHSSDLLIFIGAAGIAVRSIAPCIQNKATDPACLVIDDAATFVIPILSGHIGGANDHCRSIATALDAVPVITTATDVNNKFAVDVFATKNNLNISSMLIAREVSAAILTNNIPISFAQNITLADPLPLSLISADIGDIGILVSYRSFKPYAVTLNLIPQNLVVGIGCRKGVSAAEISDAFDEAFATHHLYSQAVHSVCSIDLKEQESGLVQFCAHRTFPITFFTAEELANTPGEFTSSNFVQSVTGVDNVCERAAVRGSDGPLILKKFCKHGVTIAVAAANKVVQFSFPDTISHE